MMVAQSEPTITEETAALAEAELQEADGAVAEPPRAATGLAMLLFVGVVIVLAVALSVWAPWRETGRLTVSDYGARQEGGAGPAAPPAPAVSATARPAVTATPAPAPTAAASSEPSRPSGLPLRRADWLIIRDYQAHGGSSPNGAIDLGVIGNRDAVGTPIYATQDGTVRVVRGNKLYGNLVAIKNSRWSTTYGHLDQVLVTDGQVVRRGEQIGTMGRTGNAASPQLDYQVWEKVNGQEVNRNPLDFLDR